MLKQTLTAVLVASTLALSTGCAWMKSDVSPTNVVTAITTAETVATQALQYAQYAWNFVVLTIPAAQLPNITAKYTAAVKTASDAITTLKTLETLGAAAQQKDVTAAVAAVSVAVQDVINVVNDAKALVKAAPKAGKNAKPPVVPGLDAAQIKSDELQKMAPHECKNVVSQQTSTRYGFAAMRPVCDD